MYPFKKIESKWTNRWLESSIYEPSLDKAKKPFYNLMMFPYPSAEGLHVGNVYAFVGSDIYGRFKRMHGEDVFEPIGLDGFGIHSENYALKVGTHPVDQAKTSEKRFYEQLKMMGNSFAWNERLETYDPEYYRWTQWIFIQMWRQGLAYKKKASVNWCPSCRTVLADEQVEGGECERCKTEVTKKDLEQWFFKITDYAEKLLSNLDKIDWPENIKTAQRNWIGKSQGSLIKFPVAETKESIEVYTTRPDTILGATYMVLAPEHPLIDAVKNRITNKKAVESYIEKSKSKTENDRMAEGKSKTGVELRGIKAINPATEKEIPVWISDYVIMSYGTGAIMAVPAYDERDEEFAKKFKIPIKKEKLVDGDEITKKVGGKKKTNYHLRDWLISRQRYWGPPIPMIHCEKCEEAGKGEQAGMPGWYAVPEKDLPVALPKIKEFKPKGTPEGPLASSPAFYKTKCPHCGSPAKRETDVSDTFLDSAWYFFRYIDVNNKKEIFKKERAKKWLPVNMYIGGAEHAVLHLLYSRFLTMVFKKMGLVNFEEPFTTLRANGLLIKEGMKMSKSRGNVVNPDQYIDKFGADVLRTYLMFLGPFQEGGDWRDAGIMGVVRFLNRTWDSVLAGELKEGGLSDWMHASIKKITDETAGIKYNTAISELMVIMNTFEEKGATKEDIDVFLRLLAPFAPFVSEELWEKVGNKYSVHKAQWPTYEEDKLIEDTFTLIIQVNGKLRGSVDVKRGISEKDALKLAEAEKRVKEVLGNKKIKKVIFVEDKLINLVI